MKLSEVIRYYSSSLIQEEIMSAAKSRETGFLYHNKQYGKRPSALFFPNEIFELSREGVVSFHCSEERWSNPLALKQDSTQKELNELRIGWDLLIDVDGKNLEYSTVCAKLLIEALKFHGVNSFSIKYSGNKGFHIGIPFESFPDRINNIETQLMFPEVPRIIIDYLKEFIFKHLSNELYQVVKKEDLNENSFIEKNNEKIFNPYSILEMDTVLIAPRHLFRMPYSLNEKTWLVSLPLTLEQFKGFDKSMAKPEGLKPMVRFFDKSKKDTKELISRAYFFKAQKENIEEEKTEKQTSFEIPQTAYGASSFPPCIKLMLSGLEDGRKRSLFILLGFLRNCGWNWEQIEAELENWNKRNTSPLSGSYLKSQINWHKKLKSNYSIPNCNNDMYYKGMAVCRPDEFCKKVKNPLSYVYLKEKNKNAGTRRKLQLRRAEKSPQEREVRE